MNIKLSLNLGDKPLLIINTNLGQFIIDNMDGMDLSELEDITRTLSRKEIYYGGGGASPEWSLERIDH